MWLYGSGFPKSMDISKQIDKKLGAEREVIGKQYKGSSPLPGNHKDTWADNQKDGEFDITKPATELAKQWEGWGTCLKPAYEPIIVARKPFKGSLVDNIIENSVGGINIDECRIGNEERTYKGVGGSSTTFIGGVFEKGSSQNKKYTVNGRFPSNVILTYDQITFDEVCGAMPYTKGNGNIRHNKNIHRNCYGKYNPNEGYGYEDEGSASRYFYCAKASKKDRDEGLDKFNQLTVDDGRNKTIDNPFQRGETLRKNTHPTVKPTELMQYLVRLVSPKSAIILDPFMGSGSTGKAVMYENVERNADYKFIGIEKEKEYCDIAEARIEYATKKQ